MRPSFDADVSGRPAPPSALSSLINKCWEQNPPLRPSVATVAAAFDSVVKAAVLAVPGDIGGAAVGAGVRVLSTESVDVAEPSGAAAAVSFYFLLLSRHPWSLKLCPLPLTPYS